MKIDMPITTTALDSSGEILHLDGVDISDFNNGKAWANWEHSSSHSEDVVGHFIFAKKIFSEKDCDTSRQKMYWDKLKTPYLYGVCELLDQDGHIGAICVASMIRYFKRRGEPVMVGASIEGSTLERDGNDLKRAVAKRAAITLAPCNKQCWVDFLADDPSLSDTVKFESKSFDSLVQVDDNIFEDIQRGISDPILDLKKAISDLQKTLTAGGGNVAPSQLVGGAALVPEHLVGATLDRTQSARLKAALRDWNRTRPLKEVVKAALPEIGDKYIDHFVDVAQDLSLKKGMPPLGRIGAQHSLNHAANDEQKKLIEGLYWDKAQDFDPGHENWNDAHRIRTLLNDAGDQVLVKEPAREDVVNTPEGVVIRPFSEDTAVNSTAYSHAAQDFFGLGDHVPTTNHFYNPHAIRAWINGTGQKERRKFQAMKFIPNAKTLMENYPTLNGKAFKKARENGTLHKIELMDMILGASGDRHDANVLIDPSGKFYHIDNDIAFNHTVPRESVYQNQADSIWGPGSTGIGRDTIHQDALKWLNGLNANKLHDILQANKLPEKAIHNTIASFMQIRHMANQGKTFNEMHQANINQVKSPEQSIDRPPHQPLAYPPVPREGG